ncbi:hypothetical protein D3C87_182050 [compost metagenome]
MSKFKPILDGACPICGKGKIFETKGSLFHMKAPKMHERCSECNYRFDKEPGYFFGAMYISYGLAVAELLPVFLVLSWFIPLGWIFAVMLVVLMLTMFFNFRVSRVLWIHIFHE